ncbi:MAG: hypothetical protein GF365_03520 [Candidatus Buchananbacteria bacterium]|nr:hypothetical protein [Candidatus Buchananbacteria bacterium]
MKLSTNNKKVLNLSDKEVKILNNLSTKKSIKITSLAKLTLIPRTSVEFYLKNLKQRGFVKKIKVQNHFEWQRTEDSDLASKFRGLIDNLDFYSEIIGKIEDKSIIVEIFRGKEKILEAANKILKFNPAYRVYYIQCVASAKYQTENFPKQFTLEFHKRLKKSGIIMEVIAAQSIMSYFDKLSKKELKSHLGRPMINYLIADEFIDFNADLIIHNEMIIILNYENESVIFIKNKLLSNIFANLFQFLQNYTKKIDLNSYIRNLMETKA